MTRIVALLLIGLGLFVVLLFSFFDEVSFHIHSVKGEVQKVPSFIGRDIEAVRVMISGIPGLSLADVVMLRTTSRQERGKVVGQRPAPNDLYEPGMQITLYVADCLRIKLLGMPVEDAKKSLRTKGVPEGKIKAVYRVAKNSIPGTVIDQKPGQDECVGTSETFILFVADCLRINLVGLSKGEAKRMLLSSGIPIENITFTCKESKDFPPDTVMNQRPDPDACIIPEVGVVLTIAIPPFLPEVTEEVRKVLEQGETAEVIPVYSMHGYVTWEEDRGPEEHQCRLNYEIWIYDDQCNRVTYLKGSINRWAYDRDRCKEFLRRELSKRVKKSLVNKE